MTSIELADSLTDVLTELFKGYTLLNKSGTLQEVKIFNQYMPQPSGVTINSKGINNYQANDYDSNFPCIIIAGQESIYQEERMLAQALHKMKFIIGIYDDNSQCQGWRDIANIEDRLINYMLVERVVGGKFRLEMPVTFKYVDVDTWPVYYGEIDMNFSVGRALQNHSYIHKLKGDYI